MDPTSTDETSSNESYNIACLKHAFELVEEGRKKIKESEERRNKILILGKTGDGKSTVSQWLAGDDTKLESKKIAPGEFLIEDGDKIGSSTINSKTIIPELVSNPKSDIALYDCGGSGDTRNISYDLAVNCLIKILADDADQVKIIFVINYSSVRKGGNKGGFMQLMEHATDLMKNVEKFRDSFALIVTKVDNTVVMSGKEWVLLDDESVTGAIADFLLEVKLELKENLQKNIGAGEKLTENSIRIIDILLTKNGRSFTKIKLFRRPEKSGPLSKITSFQNAKIDILKTLETLVYAKKSSDDFGYSLSEKSQNIVNDIVDEIIEIIWSNLKRIASHGQEHFSNFAGIIHKTIESIVFGTADVRSIQTEAQELLSKIRSAHHIIEELVGRIKSLNDVEKTVAKVIECISLLNITIPHKTTKDMMDQVKYLNFLQIVSEKKFRMRPWSDTFNNALLFFQTVNKHLQEHINESVAKIDVKIKDALEGLASVMQNKYVRIMETLDVRSLLRVLSEEKHVWLTKIKAITNKETVIEKIEELIKVNIESDFKVPGDILTRILNFKECLLYLKTLSNEQLNIDLSPWFLTLQNLAKFLEESEIRYKFSKDLYDKLSKYRVQRFKHIYNVKNIEDWGKSGVDMGIEVREENFNLFLEKISSFSVAECCSVKNLQSPGLEQDLNHILSLTLRNKINIQNTRTTVTIEGDCISLKSLFNNEYTAYTNYENTNIDTILKSKDISTVRFFASNTIFIDQDINFVGEKLCLVFIAPKWEVIGSIKIDLSGNAGDMPPTTYSSTGKVIDGGKAIDGEPGKPGGPGGNFFGIGETFINGEYLTVFTNGGRGGDGQKGQDGKKGKDVVLNNIDKIVSPIQALPSWAVGATVLFAPVTFGAALAGFGVALVGRGVTGILQDERVLDKGGKGEDGGNGGKGGEGGNPGKFFLLELNGCSRILKNDDKGRAGSKGIGGTGGASGRDKVMCGNWSKGIIVELREGYQLGTHGSNGSNTTGQRAAELAPIFNDYDIVVKDYKSFLKNPLSDRFRKYYLGQFITHLSDKFF